MILWFTDESLTHISGAQGDYNQYECGLTVDAATAEDDGEWECDFESYVKVGTWLSSWISLIFKGVFSPFLLLVLISFLVCSGRK